MLTHFQEQQRAYRQIQESKVQYWLVLIGSVVGLPFSIIWALLSLNWFAGLLVLCHFLVIYQSVRALLLLRRKQKELFSDGAANDPA